MDRWTPAIRVAGDLQPTNFPNHQAMEEVQMIKVHYVSFPAALGKTVNDCFFNDL